MKDIDIKTIDVTPAAMIQAALEKGTSIDQLGSLLALQERWEANNARRAFNAAVAAFKSNPPEIFKSKAVSFGTSKGTTSYKHALLEDIVDAATPELSKHGLSVRWEIDQGDQIAVKCILSHIDGHSESVSLRGPADDSGGKNRIQQIGSTVSYLQRYTLMSILGLAAKGVDDDGMAAIHHKSESNKITDEQVLQIEAFIADNELPLQPVMDYLNAKGYKEFAQLPAGKFDQFMAMLKRSVK